MPKDETQSVYPCMVPPGGLRRVHDPHDERPAGARQGRVKRALAKLHASTRT